MTEAASDSNAMKGKYERVRRTEIEAGFRNPRMAFSDSGTFFQVKNDLNILNFGCF